MYKGFLHSFAKYSTISLFRGKKCSFRDLFRHLARKIVDLDLNELFYLSTLDPAYKAKEISCNPFNLCRIPVISNCQ